MTKSNDSGKDVTNQNASEQSQMEKFTGDQRGAFAQFGPYILEELKDHNSKIKVTTEEVVAALSAVDYLFALEPTKRFIIIDGETYSIDEYFIPKFLQEFIPPAYVSITGRKEQPDLLVRPQGVPMDPDFVNKVWSKLFNYLRLPYVAFDRSREITLLGNLAEGSFAIGDSYIQDVTSGSDIRFFVDPKAVTAAGVWGEYAEKGAYRKWQRNVRQAFTQFLSKPEDK